MGDESKPLGPIEAPLKRVRNRALTVALLLPTTGAMMMAYGASQFVTWFGGALLLVGTGGLAVLGSRFWPLNKIWVAELLTSRPEAVRRIVVAEPDPDPDRPTTAKSERARLVIQADDGGAPIPVRAEELETVVRWLEEKAPQATWEFTQKETEARFR